MEDFEDLTLLQRAENLQTVYLERNPLEGDPNYKTKVLSILRTLRQLDALPVESIRNILPSAPSK